MKSHIFSLVSKTKHSRNGARSTKKRKHAPFASNFISEYTDFLIKPDLGSLYVSKTLNATYGGREIGFRI